MKGDLILNILVTVLDIYQVRCNCCGIIRITSELFQYAVLGGVFRGLEIGWLSLAGI